MPSVIGLLPRTAFAFTIILGLVFVLGACRSGNATTSDRVDASKVPTQTLPETLPDPIIVSGPGGRGTPTPAAALDTYTVRPGDTLAAIAVRYNTTVENLVRENGLTDAGRLEVGQTLKVPRIGTPTPAATGTRTATPAATGTGIGAGTGAGTGTPRPGSPTPATSPVPGAIRTVTPSASPGAIRTPTATAGTQLYEVKPGDTASGIASALGVTVQDLAAANDMTVAELANLQVGQMLRVPRR